MSGQQIVFVFKAMALFLSLLFFFLILVVESRLKKLRNVMAGKWDLALPLGGIPAKGALQRRWEGVIHKTSLKREADYKAAILEADSVVEEVFRKIGFPSLDVALSKNKITTEQLSNIYQLQDVHRQRSKIAHDPNVRITHEEVEEIIKVYESVLKQLQVID